MNTLNTMVTNDTKTMEGVKAGANESGSPDASVFAGVPSAFGPFSPGGDNVAGDVAAGDGDGVDTLGEGE